MRYKVPALCILAIICCQCTLASDSSTPDPLSKSAYNKRIVLAGDSTVTDQSGWGIGFAASLSDKAECINLAKGGSSSKSFYDEGFWQKVLDLKPDYVLIQFGHNDEHGHHEKETEPNTTYRANIERYIDQARDAGIEPVLITPISRRQWGKDGHIHSSLIPYADVIRQIAYEKNVYIIDLHDRSIEVYESLGKDGCDLISPVKDDGQLDGTHMNLAGSNMFGSLIAAEVEITVPGLNKYFPTSKLMQIQRTKAPRADVDSEYVQYVTQQKAAVLSDRGQTTLTVAADGTGDYLTVQDAIKAVPDNNSQRTTIHIKPGIYTGQIVLPASKPNVTFQGDSADTCIITYALTVHDPVPSKILPAKNGNGVVILADDFIANNLTFRNTAGDHGQAMALCIEGDRAVVTNCQILGWQDTLLLNTGRHYFKDCAISGRVDFIYGSAAAVFDDCVIITKGSSYVTAASTPQESDYGFVFRDCKITSPDKTRSYLGRPWRPYASVTFIDCFMDSHIRPEGWHNWRNPDNEKTARYSEYNTTGPGSNPSERVSWSHQLTDLQAKQFTIDNIFHGWHPNCD